MAQASSILFVLGVIATAIGFAAHVGHAVLLANGRRLAAAVTLERPAYATAGVTGSFVTAHAGAGGGTAGRTAAAVAASPLSRTATLVTTAAFALLVASLVVRGIVVGRGPYGNLYEFSVAFAASILGGYLLLARRYPIRQIGFIPVGIALVLLLYASSLPSEIEPLVPALQNAPLLTIHVGMAVLAYGILATAFAAGIGYLVQGSHDRFAWLPSHRTLDEVAYRAVIIGFPIFATMIVLGSWWASIAWSRYWGWDPKETAALVTWLVYAVYLHARNQRRWAGRPAALLLVIGFLMVLVTYSGSLWFSGLHAYSGL
jgi:cytochrome c-type biogenesis protein CcsB